MENQPVCHIYQWVAHPTPGGVCNHCERMMDGFRLDDLIAGLRVNSFLREQGDVGEPDLAILGFLDD